MPKIALETLINAPGERVFDLSRCLDLHADSLAHTREKAVAGVTTGLINLGESVTWEATHFGVRQRLTSKITLFERPHHFRDSMVSGAFKRFDHDHFFSEIDGQTLMKDVFDYESPLGFLGRIADFLFLEKYLENLLTVRNNLIKQVAESEQWRKFLAD
jgi:ligand-binding SRPBCC domain-containing protein